MMAGSRSAHTSELLFRIWGWSLPPGPQPYEAIAADAAWIDDSDGREDGLVVRGHGVTIADVQAVLATAPESDARQRLIRALGESVETVEGTHRQGRSP